MLAFVPPDRGVLFVVSGPSGVGKSTLVREAMARIPAVSFSVSATTRDRRRGEVEGMHYHFIDQARYDALVAEGAFLEHARVYDRAYGTLREPTEAALATGRSLVLDIDVQGSASIRARLPEAVHVYVMPPDLTALELRLTARGDKPELIARRMAQVGEQLREVGQYDYVFVNDDLPTAHATFQGILLAEMSRTSRRASAIASVLAQVPAPAS